MSTSIWVYFNPDQSALWQAVCAGEWICSADADDIMLPRRVELQLAAAQAAPPRTLLGCRFVRDPPDATWHYSLWANATTQHDLWLQQFRECTVVQPTWFYRRSLWSDLGGASAAAPRACMHMAYSRACLPEWLQAHEPDWMPMSACISSVFPFHLRTVDVVAGRPRPRVCCRSPPGFWPCNHSLTCMRCRGLPSDAGARAGPPGRAARPRG